LPLDPLSSQYYIHTISDRHNGMCCDISCMTDLRYSGIYSCYYKKATLSGIVSALVRKGLIGQTTDSEDQQQKSPCGAGTLAKTTRSD